MVRARGRLPGAVRLDALSVSKARSPFLTDTNPYDRAALALSRDPRVAAAAALYVRSKPSFAGKTATCATRPRSSSWE